MRRMLTVVSIVLTMGLLGSLLMGCSNDDIDSPPAASSEAESATGADELWASELVSKFETLMEEEGWERDEEFDAADGAQYFAEGVYATIIVGSATFDAYEVISSTREILTNSEDIVEFKYGEEDSWFWIWSLSDNEEQGKDYVVAIYDRNVIMTFSSPVQNRPKIHILLQKLDYQSVLRSHQEGH